MTPKPESSVIPKTWTALPESIRVRLGREAGPQRAMLEEGHLLVIIHLVPKPDRPTRQPALFWRQPSGEWRSSTDGPGVRSIADVIRVYDETLERLDDEENRAQDARTYHRVLEELAPVLRASRGLHRALQQARDLVKSERDLINYRDQAATIERNAELLLQDAQFGLDFIAAKQAEAQAVQAKSQAAAAHRLNLLAALFLPLTTIASVYGMSVPLPGTSSPGIFWTICGIGAALGLGLSLAIVKSRRGG
ncbi:MAG: magnesium transporter CorA family protein [Verrucomicrobiales bacterium]|nr:magnesium transporter CorA family protein [Verrucomicrobiales bacterium]